MIKIGIPYLIYTEDNKVRLCSKVSSNSWETQEIWYEVDSKYESFFCFERADSFLLAFLPYAMMFAEDIVVEGKISEKLYYQIVNIFMPAITKYSNFYQKVSIQVAGLDSECMTSSENHIKDAVGTGFSAGVDSFFTIYKNLNQDTKSFNLTHLCFFNLGACGTFDEVKALARYQKRIELFKGFVEENNLNFVCVNSNIAGISRISFNYTHTFLSLSAVLALQKLFKIYYYSSGCGLDEFCFNYKDAAFFDLLNVQCFSTEGTNFYVTGASESRCDKLDYISQFDAPLKMLNVCNDNDVNCRTCEKCVRTMACLYALGKLDLFNQVFDIDDFKKNLARRLAFMMAKKYDGSIEGNACKEIFPVIRKNKRHVPISTYFYFVPYFFKYCCMGLARKSTYLTRLWHKFNHKKIKIRYKDI